MAFPAVPENVISPLTVIVPVETVTVEVFCPEPETIAMLPAVNVPVPTATSSVPEFPGVTNVRAPVKVNELVPLIVTIVAAVGPVAKVIEAHTAAVSTVTLAPLLIVTGSPDVGTPLGDQVPAVFQRPPLVLFAVE